MIFHILLEPDDEVDGLFLVTSPDVPGLVTGGKSLGEIMAKVRRIVPALIERPLERDDRFDVTIRHRYSGGGS